MQPSQPSKYQQFLDSNQHRAMGKVDYRRYLFHAVNLLYNFVGDELLEVKTRKRYMVEIHRSLPDLREIALEEIKQLQTEGKPLNKALLAAEDAPPILRIFVDMTDQPGFDIGVQEKGENGVWRPCAMLDAVRRVMTGEDEVLDIEPFRDTRELRFHAGFYIEKGFGLPAERGAEIQENLENDLAELEAAGTGEQPVTRAMTAASVSNMYLQPDCPFSMSLMYDAIEQLGLPGRRNYVLKHLDQLIIQAYYELQDVQKYSNYHNKRLNLSPDNLKIGTSNPPAVVLLSSIASRYSDVLAIPESGRGIYNIVRNYTAGIAQVNDTLTAMKPEVDQAIQRARQARHEQQKQQRQTWVQRIAPSGLDLSFLREVHQSVAKQGMLSGRLLGDAGQPSREPTEWDFFAVNTVYAPQLMVSRFRSETGIEIPVFDYSFYVEMRKAILCSPHQVGQDPLLFIDAAMGINELLPALQRIATKYNLPACTAQEVYNRLEHDHPQSFIGPDDTLNSANAGMPQNFTGTVQAMVQSRKMYIEMLQAFANYQRQRPTVSVAEAQENSARAAYVEKHISVCQAKMIALEVMSMSPQDDKRLEAVAKRAVWVVPGLVAFAGGAFATKFAGTELANQALDAMNDMLKGQFDKLGQGLAAGNPALWAMVLGIGIGAVGLVIGLWKGAAIIDNAEFNKHDYDKGLDYIAKEVFQKLTPAQRRVPEQAR